jgi:hypothetical protein
MFDQANPPNAQQRSQMFQQDMANRAVFARGALPEPDMNGTERAYAQLLDVRQKAGEIAWWRFEGITLKLADDTRYTPDFAVMLADGTMEMHETKGFMREDAHVKIKVAAAQFPFKFRLLKMDRKARIWHETEL